MTLMRIRILIKVMRDPVSFCPVSVVYLTLDQVSGMEKFGSGINISHLQHCIGAVLNSSIILCKLMLFFAGGF
jgi:hypothetical protein